MLEKESRNDLIKSLQKYVLSKLPSEDSGYTTEGYDDYNKTMYLLIAINIFQTRVVEEITNKKELVRFDFYSYQTESWSLEHIFPQNPNIDSFEVKNDKRWVLDKVSSRIKILESRVSLDNEKENEKVEEIKKLHNLIAAIKNDEAINSLDIDFIFDEINNVDDLGNMALLIKGVNSSLSNKFFNTKRLILLDKLNTGSFVPKHTIDVFSKMLNVSSKDSTTHKFAESLTTWSKEDIKANKYWIENRAEELVLQFRGNQYVEPIENIIKS